MRKIFAAALCAILLIGASRQAGAQIVGGFRSVSETDEGVVAAAAAAIETRDSSEQVSLLDVVSARQQVVAGIKYELTMNVMSGDLKRSAIVMIVRKLDRSYEVLSWDWQPDEDAPKTEE